MNVFIYINTCNTHTYVHTYIHLMGKFLEVKLLSQRKSKCRMAIARMLSKKIVSICSVQQNS